jgi:hypothetical protein
MEICLLVAIYDLCIAVVNILVGSENVMHLHWEAIGV